MRKAKSIASKTQASKQRAKTSAPPRRASSRPPKRGAPGGARPHTGLGAKGWKDTKFVISHLQEEDFRIDGLRPYAAYRDLGIAKGTNGLVRAHVIRNVRPFNAADVSKRHFHDVDFQLIYCIKGTMKSEMDGQVLDIKAGTCWIQPSGIKHTVLDYSDDLELLEIIMPADFDTVEVPL